jgi:hypothetical protein
MLSLSISPCHDQELTLCTAYTEYGIYLVLHTPPTASFLDWLSPAPSQFLIFWHTMLYWILYIPTITSNAINRVWVPFAPHIQTALSSLSASKISANLARSWPPRTFPYSLNHCLQHNLETHSIITYKCRQSWAPSKYLQTCLIIASKYIDHLTRLGPPTASPFSYDYGLHLCIIMAFKCMSKLSWTLSPGACWRSGDHGLHVYPQNCSILAPKCIPTLPTNSSY